MFRRVIRLLRERRIPDAVSRSWRRQPEKSRFWRLARVLYREPVDFYRIFGCFPLPVQTVSYRAFAHEAFAPVELAAPQDAPPCPHPVNDWRRWTTDLPEALRNDGIASCHLVRLPEGFADDRGNIFSRSGQLVTGASLPVQNDVNAYYTPSRLHPPTYRGERVAALTSSHQDNYYHWLMEVLPRLAMLGESWLPDGIVYVSQAKPFQRETLALLRVPPKRS